MIETRSTRLLALLLLAGMLCGLLLWAGTLEPDPDRNQFPDETEFAVDYNTYVGERVEFGGTVVATDPVVVEVTADSGRSLELTLQSVDNADRINADDEITVYGTLEPNNTVTVIDTTVRQPWESYYMYLVSFLAGLWTLGRFLRQWTVDRRTLSVTPREVD
jgi:hypothetical protein